MLMTNLTRSSSFAGGGGDEANFELFTDASRPLLHTVILASVLLLLILSCVIGNFFVILAILSERDLRGRPQYYLIFSLAVADLIVGIVVTPLGAWNTVTGAWTLGRVICELWISVDVLVCTSSILHLVAIALDRYWSITDICYVQNRTPRRIIWMLAGIWLTSLLISLSPLAPGWYDNHFIERIEKDQICLINQTISYQVFSTATAFYIPLIAIICVYWKIMRAAKRRFKRERDRKTVIRPPPDHMDDKKAPLINKKVKKIPLPPAVVISDIQNGNGVVVAGVKTGSISLKVHRESSSSASEEERTQNITAETKLDNEQQTTKARSNSGIMIRRKRRPKETAETKRERKAWRTLAIITGTFVACWTPFFLVSLYRPICGCKIPDVIEQVTLWLGYLNSALNPIIYTVFSQDFRAAFKRIVKRLCLITEY